jgi:hypothetical protein
MVCTTITISAVIVQVSNVTATLISAGNIKIRWNQDTVGTITIKRNDVTVFTWNETTTGAKDWDSMNNVSGTYTFCVNTVCAAPITLQCTSTVWACELPYNGYEFDGCGNRRLNSACDALVACNSISKDTWKPATTNPKSGENLAITVRSNETNKAFNIGYADAVTLERHVILSGTTDENGCYTGEIPAQADGTYKLTVCFLVLNISCPITAPIYPISITWGTKSMDWQTMVLISAGILGLAYVIGQRK